MTTRDNRDKLSGRSFTEFATSLNVCQTCYGVPICLMLSNDEKWVLYCLLRLGIDTHIHPQVFPSAMILAELKKFDRDFSRGKLTRKLSNLEKKGFIFHYNSSKLDVKVWNGQYTNLFGRNPNQSIPLESFELVNTDCPLGFPPYVYLILEYFLTNPHTTTEVISKKFNIRARRVRGYFKQLLDKSLIIQESMTNSFALNYDHPFIKNHMIDYNIFSLMREQRLLFVVPAHFKFKNE